MKADIQIEDILKAEHEGMDFKEMPKGDLTDLDYGLLQGFMTGLIYSKRNYVPARFQDLKEVQNEAERKRGDKDARLQNHN